MIDARPEDRDHYEFGRNWAEFGKGVSETHAAAAVASLRKLVGDKLDGLSFIDIGCGSGLHTFAALRLGAASALAVDLDADSVATAQRLLTRLAAGKPWQVKLGSVFGLAASMETYDVVYSWGVLHHTGRMWDAIAEVARLVKPNGRLVIAIYRRTPFCGFWRVEKRLYTASGPAVRRAADLAMASAKIAALSLVGRNPLAYIRDYVRMRGMTFMTDVRDWLGGYPYESASPVAISTFVTELGFERIEFFPCNTRVGLLGVGCDEYVFRRRPS